MGVHRGTRHLKPAPEQRLANLPSQDYGVDDQTEANRWAEPEQSLERLFPGGQLVQTDVGACFVLDHVYPLSYLHGTARLGELSNLPFDVAALFNEDPRLNRLEVGDLLFLDTETTGLTGAGTIAFMVGVAFLDRQADQQAFVVRQYFLRDHGDEAAMLTLLAELLTERPVLVTFNGRSFDLPLLDTRYLMNRLDGLVGELRERPHLDLLIPARRLWRSRIGSCALGSLETNVLGIQRAQEDIPGWAIPGLYLDYLRTGDARELSRVFYHNQIDMLSMATLIGQIIRLFHRPGTDDHPLDLLSLGRWQASLGLTATAEQNFRLAADQDMPIAEYQETLKQLALLLKRSDRREEALPLWQQIAVTSFDEIEAHIELAKYYEWHQQDLERAVYWTQSALALTDSWDPVRASLIVESLQYRLNRLEGKLNHE